MKAETITFTESLKAIKPITFDELMRLKSVDELDLEVSKHIFELTERSKRIKGINSQAFTDTLNYRHTKVIESKCELGEKACIFNDMLKAAYDFLSTIQERNKTKVNPDKVNSVNEEHKENPVIDVIKENPIKEEKEAVMVGRLNSKVKRRLDNWVLKGLDPESKGSIKQRLGQKLAERRAFVLPRIRLDKDDIGTAYDVRVQKNGINKHFDLVVEEYVDGTLKTADGSMEYGWLALNNEKSVYPVKFTLNDVDGNKLYEAVSLTKESFDFYVKDEHQRYGLYVINGLGMLAANLTKEDHLVLTYLKGKKGNTKDYMYGHNAIIGRSLQMISLMDAARFDQLIPEGEL